MVSVVTPTYNRADSLKRTLESLARQAYPDSSYEVVVVDDGSSDNTKEVCESFDTLSLHYVLQDHAGGTQAKNTGALASRGDLLVFLDDDITVVPQFIRCLVEEHLKCNRLIVVGTLHPVTTNNDSPHSLPPGSFTAEDDSSLNRTSVAIPFTDCLGGFFSVRHSDFLELGMLQDPAPGFWPNWEDVDLAYRALLKGFHFRRSVGAVGYHWDHVLRDLRTRCDREERAARAAVKLFQRHPDLQYQIPMFRDKGPISFSADPSDLIVRKAMRSLVSSPPCVFAMRRLAHLFEIHRPNSRLLVLLHRWLVSAHIYKGYRQGLHELAEAKE
jgi:glycosyltransferase involved in cell wall biosynthesis